MNTNNTKMEPQTIEDLEKLTAFINDTHLGDYASVSRDLYQAVYYLHHLEESSVGIVEIRNTCFTLHSIAECFFKVHRQRRRQQYQIIKEELDVQLTDVNRDDLWAYSI